MKPELSGKRESDMEAPANNVNNRVEKQDSFGKVVKILSLISDRINIFGISLAGFTLAAMMFLTFFDVGGRYLLKKPITGAYEVTEFMMVLLVGFGLAYCGLRRGHIRVDLIFDYVSSRANLWLDVFAYGVSFIFYAVIVWQGWINAMRSLGSDLTSVLLKIPVYPFTFVLVVALGFLSLVFLRDFLKSIEELRKR